jgi:hypothetical protein
MAFLSWSSTARGIFPGAPEKFYEAFAGYNAWQEWIPSVTSSRLLTREDILAVVEVSLGEVGLGGKGGGTLMLECIETPGKGVLASVIEGRILISEIHWSVEPADPNFSKVSVTLKWKIGLHLLNPAHWPILNPATCLAALQSWVSAAHPGPEAVRDGENLFELWETEAGLVCWIRGRKYQLTPVDDNKA